jgi:serine/threonine protein kinase
MVEQKHNLEQKLKEIYKIESVINKGNFALVKKAQNRETGEYVAIKVIPKKKTTLNKMEEYSNFSGQIDILKEIDHPNIVQMTATFEDDFDYAMILELM